MKIRDILGEDDVKIEPAPANMQQVKNANGDVIATGPADKLASVQQAAKDGVDFTPGGDEQQTSEDQEENHYDSISQGNHDIGGDATDDYINQVRDRDFERAQHEDIFGLGNKSPEEWAKTSPQMATLLQFQQKYQGTPYADQIAKRIQLLKDRLDMDAGEVAGPGGAPKPVVPPDQFDMKQLKEADNALLEKMRMIAGLR